MFLSHQCPIMAYFNGECSSWIDGLWSANVNIGSAQFSTAVLTCHEAFLLSFQLRYTTFLPISIFIQLNVVHFGHNSTSNKKPWSFLYHSCIIFVPSLYRFYTIFVPFIYYLYVFSFNIHWLYDHRQLTPSCTIRMIIYHTYHLIPIIVLYTIHINSRRSFELITYYFIVIAGFNLIQRI